MDGAGETFGGDGGPSLSPCFLSFRCRRRRRRRRQWSERGIFLFTFDAFLHPIGPEEVNEGFKFPFRHHIFPMCSRLFFLDLLPCPRFSFSAMVVCAFSILLRRQAGGRYFCMTLRSSCAGGGRSIRQNSKSLDILLLFPPNRPDSTNSRPFLLRLGHVLRTPM